MSWIHRSSGRCVMGVYGRLIHSWNSELRQGTINLETLDYTEAEPWLNNWINSMARIGDQPRRVKTLICAVCQVSLVKNCGAVAMAYNQPAAKQLKMHP